MHSRRDLYMWKETCICEKRPVYVKRDLYKDMWKETCICEKRPVQRKETRHAQPPPRDDRLHSPYKWKERYMCEKRPVNVERDLCQETQIAAQRAQPLLRDFRLPLLYMYKERYMCEKRPICVKWEVYVWKETYMCEKRPLQRDVDHRGACTDAAARSHTSLPV